MLLLWLLLLLLLWLLTYPPLQERRGAEPTSGERRTV